MIIFQLYKIIIEQPIIKRVEEYYGPKSVEDFQSMSFPDYLLMVRLLFRILQNVSTIHFHRQIVLISY